jgi:fructose-bisphosphate aldolase class I
MPEHWSPYAAELIETAKKIVTPGKGILAADESTGTIGKRFSSIQVENNEANRTAYRELLFSTPGIEEFISGVITFEETLFAKTTDGKKQLCDLLREKGIIVGIKTDKGTTPLPGTDGETATLGLDGLLERSKKYYEAGARFAKWRAVLKIDPATGCPSQQAITENAHTLARYGAISQMAGLVPIIEPEVLMDGSHTIEQAAAAQERMLAAVYKAIQDQNLLLEGTLLKPAMTTPGAEHKPAATPAEIAFYTVRTLSRTVPPAVPGIVFLSGGQSEIEATQNLAAINNVKNVSRPWALSFSYGRALQQSCLKAWSGNPANVAAAQEAFLKRCRANGQAQLGKLVDADGASQESLYVKDYKY